MDDNFGVAVERVLKHEGGFVDHPRDPGGATNFGITQAVARAHGYTGSMKVLPRETAIAIYRKDYWDAIKGDQLPSSVAFQVFDAAVNHGPGNAVRWLQRAAGVADDGKFGAVTLAAVLATRPDRILLAFNAVRLDFYTRLSTFDSFGKGWVRRLAGNLQHAADDSC